MRVGFCKRETAPASRRLRAAPERDDYRIVPCPSGMLVKGKTMSDDVALNLVPDQFHLDFLKYRKIRDPYFMPPYQVMVVDNEEVTHQITAAALQNLYFENQKVQLIHLYSMEDAKLYIDSNSEIVAVLLLDDAMENDEAGLKLVKYIREDLNNSMTRIILRTRQPGTAPDERLMVEYDINDFRLKTELASNNLVSMVLACLRNYRDINRINYFRNGLERAIKSTSILFGYDCLNLSEFLGDLVKRVANVNNASDMLVIRKRPSKDGRSGMDEYTVLLATGVLKALEGADAGQIERELEIDLSSVANIDQQLVVCEPGGKRTGCCFVGQHTPTVKNHEESYLYIVTGEINDISEKYINLFLRNLSLALDSYLMKQDADDALSEILKRVSGIVEVRDGETGNHVVRVSAISCLIAMQVGMEKHEMRDFRIASMMHDVGKIGVKDSVLLKPGRLTPEEFEHIKTHTLIGGRLFENARHPMARMAGAIAMYHHERWNGTGYPCGLAGEEIPVYARIVSIADVFDALTNDRVYKKAWPMHRAKSYLQEQSGEMFDPRLVSVFMENYSQILTICEKYQNT